MGLVEALAILSPLIAVIFAVLAWRRGAKNDDTATAREMASLTSEVRQNKENINKANEYLERNAAKILAQLEHNTEKLEARIERNAEKLEARIDAEHRRIDNLERGSDKNEN